MSGTANRPIPDFLKDPAMNATATARAPAVAPTPAALAEKAKALQAALAQIEKQFGKGTIMRGWARAR